jgi:hypothetical protein
MSFFRLLFLNAHLLVIMLTVVAGDHIYVQEAIGKEGRLHFKNAALQQRYGQTAEVSWSSCCARCHCVCLHYSEVHIEPVETCRVTAWYMYHIRWRIVRLRISVNELRPQF